MVVLVIGYYGEARIGGRERKRERRGGRRGVNGGYVEKES